MRVWAVGVWTGEGVIGKGGGVDAGWAAELEPRVGGGALDEAFGDAPRALEAVAIV